MEYAVGSFLVAISMTGAGVIVFWIYGLTVSDAEVSFFKVEGTTLFP